MYTCACDSIKYQHQEMNAFLAYRVSYINTHMHHVGVSSQAPFSNKPMSDLVLKKLYNTKNSRIWQTHSVSYLLQLSL